MKNTYLLLLLLLTLHSFSQKNRVSVSIESNENFIGTEQFKLNDLDALKSNDFSVFYELFATEAKSESYLVSFSKITFKNQVYILKCAYDKNNIVKSAAISSISKTDTEKIIAEKLDVSLPPCTRYNYSIWDCIKHLLDM